MDRQGDPEHCRVRRVLERSQYCCLCPRNLEREAVSAHIMNWDALTSTLIGAVITYSAILLTQAMDVWKRKRTHDTLIQALLHALQEEVESLLEMARMNAPSVEDIPDGKPYERLFSARQDY